MPINVFFAAGADLWPRYRAPLEAALADAGLDATLSDTAPDPGLVDYIVFAPDGLIADFGPYTRTKAVLNLWAGVEKIVPNRTLTQPLCRMVDPSMTDSMVEYVVGHAMRHHLGMDVHIKGQDGVWRNDAVAPPLAQERRVTVLGMGELGTACARMLAALHFGVTGWSRSAKSIPGIDCLSGDDGLVQALARADILVTLLPNTPETDNLLDATRLALLPKGAFIVNPGRGNVIDDDALLAALDAGQVAHATLDVFRTEPLPPPIRSGRIRA